MSRYDSKHTARPRHARGAHASTPHTTPDSHRHAATVEESPRRGGRLRATGGVLAALTVASIAGLTISSPGGADAATASSVSLAPVADTYVTSGAAGSNLGTEVRVQASAQPGHVKFALLRFQVPNLSGAVTDAQLVLTRDTHHLDSVVYANSVTGSWSEKSATYANAPKVGAVLDSESTDASTKSVSLNVTNAVTSNSPVDLAVTSKSTTGFASFRSREWGSEGPQLVLTVSAPTVAPTTSASTSSSAPAQQSSSAPAQQSSSAPAQQSSSPSSATPTSAVPTSATSASSANSANSANSGSSDPAAAGKDSPAPSYSVGPATSTSSGATVGGGISLSCVNNAKGIPSNGAYVGAAAGGSQNVPSLESKTGMPLAIHRTYYNADQVSQAIAVVNTDLATGRLPWISFKMPYSWADMAAGRGDAWAIDLTQRLAQVNGPVWLAFHHEPEGDGNLSDWTAMQRHLAPIVHQYSNNVAYTTILIAWDSFNTSQYNVNSLWPGDGLIDIAGWDMYNNYGTSRGGSSHPMLDPSVYFTQMQAFAKAHHVGWAIAETGYTNEAAQVDPQYLTHMYNSLVAHGGLALTYFDSSLNSIADWTLDMSSKVVDFTKLLGTSPRVCG